MICIAYIEKRSENLSKKDHELAAEKKFLRVLNGASEKTPPFWLMRQAGRYLPEYRAIREKTGTFLDLCYSPEMSTEVTLQPIRRFGMDAAILFADILLVPDGLGQKVEFGVGEGPVLEPVRDARALAALDQKNIDAKIGSVYETVARLSKALPPETALIGFAGAPWTVATYMVEGKRSRDFAEAKKWAYTAPDEFQYLINILVDATIHYLGRQIEAGAEAIQLFDTWAGTLPETEFRKWCIEPTRQIIDSLRAKYPGVPMIGFPRGAGVLLKEFVEETKVDCVSLDTAVPLEWARDIIQPLCAVQGNLDPLMLVAGGEALKTATLRILETLSAGPFVFNLGHGIIPQTPPEHVGELADIIGSWGN